MNYFLGRGDFRREVPLNKGEIVNFSYPYLLREKLKSYWKNKVTRYYEKMKKLIYNRFNTIVQVWGSGVWIYEACNYE